MTDGELTGRRVLVIEDEALVSMLLEEALSELGCEVVGFASRYPDALAKATSLSYDVAIVDLNLNGQMTVGIAEAMRERRVPFVLATGYGEAGLPASIQGAPMVAKPFLQRELAQALLTALG
jgi:CheY-like chemotaxis protein